MKKIIITILTLAVISIIAYFVLSSNKEKQPTLARIDLTTDLVNKSAPVFEAYVDGSETAEKQAEWMTKNKLQGYVIQKDGENIDIVVKPLKDSQIKVYLRGPWEKDANDTLVENWVKYTFMTVNDEEVLLEPVDVWHNKPFIYSIDTQKGDEYKIHLEWTKK